MSIVVKRNSMQYNYSKFEYNNDTLLIKIFCLLFNVELAITVPILENSKLIYSLSYPGLKYSGNQIKRKDNFFHLILIAILFNIPINSLFVEDDLLILP